MDQASQLRDIVRRGGAQNHDETRVITVTSGKGGVGKTNFTINLAIFFASMGRRVVVVDADFGLANIEVLLGIIPDYSLADVLAHRRSIQDVLTPGPKGVSFLSGGSGFSSLANISEKQMQSIINAFSFLDEYADVIIVDTGAGISRSVTNFVHASSETIVITTTEPTSITDAYALIKSIREDGAQIPQISVVVNRADSPSEGVEVFEKLHKVSKRFLNLDLTYLGSVGHDQNLVRAVKQQQPAIIAYPNTPFSQQLSTIGRKLLDLPVPVENRGGMKTFLKRLVKIFGS